MTTAHPRSIAAAALTIAALLLAGCSSGSATGKSNAANLPSQSASAEVATTAASSTSQAATAVASSVGSSSTTTSSADPVGALPAACRLITENDVSAAMGADPGSGRPFSSHGSTQCQYGSYQKQFVLVNLNPTRGRAAFDLMHNNPKLHNAKLHAVDVSGVGDRALGISGPGTSSIYFNKGDALVVISVAIRTAPSPNAQALSLAKIAASRL